MEVSQKKLKIELPIWPRNPTPGYISKKIKTLVKKKYTYSNVQSSTIYNCQDIETTKCPPTDEWIKKMCVYIYNGILCSLEKEINFAICNDRDDVEGIMLSEISQIKTNIVWSPLYLESEEYNKLGIKQKRSSFTDIENKAVVIPGEREGGGAIKR